MVDEDLNEEMTVQSSALRVWGKYALMGLFGGVLIAGVFVLGAAVTCENGGGQLSKLSCINVDVVEACEFEGNLYGLPDVSGDELNWSLG